MSLFNRSINVEVEEENGGVIRLNGRLRDTQQGKTIHEIEANMSVRVTDGEIVKIEGKMLKVPMDECSGALKTLKKLRGNRVRPGYGKLVRQNIGSNEGCVHLASLLLAMGNVSVQGSATYARERMSDEGETNALMRKVAEELNLLDSCICWREDGPIVREWEEKETL
ncbi:MAG: DUF2889 domain-containing protein [Actinomycetota bacterium]|nr:DUF2889 domain-containing protein [Actinomycetota bacterium]